MKRRKSALCVLQYDCGNRYASLAELARSPVRSSAVARFAMDGEKIMSVGVASSVGQSTTMRSYGFRCSGGRDTQSITSNF